MLALVLLLAAVPIGAHTVGKGLATITVDGQTIQYNLLVALTAAAPEGFERHAARTARAEPPTTHPC